MDHYADLPFVGVVRYGYLMDKSAVSERMAVSQCRKGAKGINCVYWW
jgi:hypothetical protein